jgi:hypothetical protein
VLVVAWIARSFPTLTRYRTGMELEEVAARERIKVTP